METSIWDILMFCGECGTENPDINHFCKNCGKPLKKKHLQPEPVPAQGPAQGPANPKKPVASKKWVIIGAIIAVFVIAGIFVFIYPGGGGPKDTSMLAGQTQYQGTLPSLAPVSYTTSEGTTLTTEYTYSGLITLLVSEAATDVDVRSAVSAEGGIIIDAIPSVGIYTVQVPPDRIAGIVSALLKKPFVIAAAPASPVTEARASLIDSFTGPDDGCRPHGKRVEEVVRQITDRPVKEIKIDRSATYPLKSTSAYPALPVVGTWYPVLGRQLINEMENAQNSGERVTIGMSLQSIASSAGNRKELWSVCNSSATPLAMDCRVTQQEQIIFLEQIFQTVQRAPPAVRKNTAIVVASGNAGVDLTNQIAELNRLYPEATKSIRIVGATGDDGNIYREFNYASSGIVYALGTDVPTGQGTCWGTSFSAPAVVGILDEMWNAAPGLTSDQLNTAFDDALRSCPGAAPSGNIVPHISAGTTARGFTSCAIDRAKIIAGLNVSLTPTKTSMPPTGTATVGVTTSQPTVTAPPKTSTPTLVPITQKTPPTGPLVFSAGSPPPASSGTKYQYSFCTPAPKTSTDLCGPGTANPSGGNPPYHFELGPGVGFPPMGLSLNLNGLLTGVPSTTGTSHFQVCAVDLSANRICRDVVMAVSGDSMTGNWQGTWQIGVDVSEFCSNMGRFTYSGPLTMKLSDSNGAISGSGSLSGVKSLNIGGDMSCTPVDAGSFSFSVSGSKKDKTVRMVLDFGNPDLFISSLNFDGTVSTNDLSGSLSGDLIQSGHASATKQ